MCTDLRLGGWRVAGGGLEMVMEKLGLDALSAGRNH